MHAGEPPDAAGHQFQEQPIPVGQRAGTPQAEHLSTHVFFGHVLPGGRVDGASAN